MCQKILFAIDDFLKTTNKIATTITEIRNENNNEIIVINAGVKYFKNDSIIINIFVILKTNYSTRLIFQKSLHNFELVIKS